MAGAPQGILETMNANFKYYYSLKEAAESRDQFRIASMSNEEWRQEYGSLQSLKRGLENVVEYLQGKARPQNQYDLELFNGYVAEARAGLGIPQGASNDEIIAACSAAVQDIDALQQKLIEIRRSYFKYDEGSVEGAAAIRNEKEARAYLSRYVPMLENGTLQNHLNNLLKNNNMGDAGRAEYNTMLRCAVLLRGDVTKEGRIKDRLDWFFGYSFDEINRVADAIIKYNYNKEGFLNKQTRTGDFGRRNEIVQSAYAASGAEMGNRILHLPEGTTFRQSGLGEAQLGKLALSLDGVINNNIQQLKSYQNKVSGSEIDAAVDKQDANALMQYFKLLGHDSESAAQKAEDVVNAKAQTLKAWDIVSTMSKDEYMNFLVAYLCVGEDNPQLLPVWENRTDYINASNMVKRYMANKNSAENFEGMGFADIADRLGFGELAGYIRGNPGLFGAQGGTQ